MRFSLKRIFLGFGLLCTVANAANILVVLPMPARSHSNIVSSLAKELAVRGHNVTYATFFPEKKVPNNFHQVELSAAVFKDMKKEFNPFNMKNMPIVSVMLMMWGMMTRITEMGISSPNLQELIQNKGNKFDAVVLESFFDEAYYGLAEVFDAPVVGLCPYVGSASHASMVGAPWNPAYVPESFLSYSDHMTFWERMHNTFVWLYLALGHEFYYLPKQQELLSRYFNTQMSIQELEKRVGVLLINSHISISTPRPMTPNLIPVGGLHIKPPKKLDEEWQRYLDSSPNGVIYFSMGSNLKSAEFPEDKRNAFLEAFSKLDENILWKWEEDVMPGQPKNVRFGSWLPQNDILAHPNVKLFITHGGLLSTQEAVYHGVPLLGIPIFGDQDVNIKQAELSGFAFKLDFANITAESVYWSIKHILNTPSFKENTKRLSTLFHDRPEKPMDTAVYWIEYVIRHKGAKHLRSASLDLSWHQYLLLDILMLGVTALLVPVLLLWILCCRKRGQKPIKVGKQKKNR